MQARGITAEDSVIGIAASGRTPYTVGALRYAVSLGCFTAGICCVPDSPLTKAVEIAIVPIVGAEAIAGSSRMKAGTAQKMILNMISTAAMIKLGFVKGNRMTNVKSSNAKLKERVRRILMAETGLDEQFALDLLNAADYDLRVAIVAAQTGATVEAARQTLIETSFIIEKAIEKLSNR